MLVADEPVASTSESIYMFEGTDYSQTADEPSDADLEAFDKILSGASNIPYIIHSFTLYLNTN